ncbi:MAG: NAD-dependent epimerase/dehydratase family protein [Flavobacteriales bacterium]|nr:NAD-dependent epimerase/dehydratase family protein [Flavobacteriales bacterium]
MKALVTGGAGFIGAHVTKHVLDLGMDVVVLDDLSGGFEDNVDPRAVFVKGSVEDNALVDRLFEEHGFDYVYHLAAYAAEGLSHFIRRFNYNNNLIGSINLINASVVHKVKCFVFTSSIAVYGEQDPPMREDMTPKPEDPYGIAKYAVEMDLKCAHEMFGLNSIVFRPHNVYGEFQNIGDRYRNVVGIFMNQLMQGKDLTVFGDGEQTRAFSYIDDVAPIIARSVEVKGAYNEVFNIGADQEYSVKELASAVVDAMKTEGKLLHLPPRNEVVHAYADHSKVRRVFGEQDYASLEEGIRKMVDWAKLVGSRASTTFDNIEIEENLPPIWNN